MCAMDMWPSHVSVQGPETQHRGLYIYKTNSIENKGAIDRKKDKLSLKKDKGNLPKGPKVSSCPSLGVKRREVGKKKV